MDREDLYLDHRSLKTKKALESSVLHLLKHKEFEDIYITDIVKKANINRGSFYNHFKDKNELLYSIITKKNKELIYAYREPFLKNRPFILSQLPSSEVKLFNTIDKNSEYYSTILNSDVSDLVEKEMFEAFKKINMEELNVKSNIIQSDLIASYIAHAIVGLILQWVCGGYKYEAEFMNSQLLELMRVSPYQTFHTKVIEKQI